MTQHGSSKSKGTERMVSTCVRRLFGRKKSVIIGYVLMKVTGVIEP